jgi:hypothetical protein
MTSNDVAVAMTRGTSDSLRRSATLSLSETGRLDRLRRWVGGGLRSQEADTATITRQSLRTDNGRSRRSVRWRGGRHRVRGWGPILRRSADFSRAVRVRRWSVARSKPSDNLLADERLVVGVEELTPIRARELAAANVEHWKDERGEQMPLETIAGRLLARVHVRAAVGFAAEPRDPRAAIVMSITTAEW